MTRENLKLMHDLHKAYTKSKHPNIEDKHIPGYKKRDNNANGLTDCIRDFLTFKGWQAERISSAGKYDPRLKRFVFSTSTNGTADISATIKGLSVKIEVKFGKDRLSENQKKYRDDVIKAGGIYYVAKDFDSFVEWYNENFERD